MSIPGNGHLPAAASTGLPDHSSASSDSEVEVEVEGDADYLPISGAASDTDSDPDPDPDLASHRRLDAVDNGVAELDLASDEEESDEEEGTGATEAAAALDDERRRRAQLPAGAAARIVDAMRGVAFPGAPPPWAGAVPDEQWLERLRSLRGGRD